MTTNEFNELKRKYSIYDDVDSIFDFVAEILYWRRKELEAKEPYATRSISALDSAEHEVYDLIDYIGELEDKNIICIDGVEINKNIHTLKIHGQSVNIPPQELSLLSFLVSNCNKIFTRDELFEQVWGFNYRGDSRTVDVHIRRLRQKLDGVSDKWSLKTVWGKGYMFEVIDNDKGEM